MNNSFCPKARNHELLIREVDDETLVYDLKTDKASCLNDLTTSVWNACDGKTSIESILDKLRRADYRHSNINLIWVAIDQLEQAGLLEEPISPEWNKNRTSRREMFRMLGKGVIGALPVISTISIQPAIAQVSGPCSPKHGPCSSNSDCCSNRCHPLPLPRSNRILLP